MGLSAAANYARKPPKPSALNPETLNPNPKPKTLNPKLGRAAAPQQTTGGPEQDGADPSAPGRALPAPPTPA